VRVRVRVRVCSTLFKCRAQAFASTVSDQLFSGIYSYIHTNNKGPETSCFCM